MHGHKGYTLRTHHLLIARSVCSRTTPVCVTPRPATHNNKRQRHEFCSYCKAAENPTSRRSRQQRTSFLEIHSQSWAPLGWAVRIGGKIPEIPSTPLTYEEMSTLLTKVEACVNSRPLTELSRDPSDLRALTPAHFLIQGELHALPEPDLPDKIPALRRWQIIQQLSQHFWQRWASEYLTRLQQRPKWAKPTPNLAEGQLVLIKEDGQKPLYWKLARIMKIHTGDDKLVRAATLKTSTSTLQRPIVKLCPLPLD